MTDTSTGLTAVKTGNNAVQLSWTAPASNTPPVTGYEVFFAKSGNNTTQSVGTIIGRTITTINVPLPIVDDIYGFLVVAFSDTANTLPSANSSTWNIFHSKLNFLSIYNEQ